MSDDSAERPRMPSGDEPPPVPADDAGAASMPPRAGAGGREGSPAPSARADQKPAPHGGARLPHRASPEPPPVVGDAAPIIPSAHPARSITPAGGRWSDERVEAWIGMLLRSGVILAAIVASIGAVFFIAHYGARRADYHTFRAVPAGLDSVAGVVAGALALRSRWIIQLGLLLLIATPIARVAFSLVAFVLQRDRMYVLVTALVLGLLLFSLMGPGF